MILLSFDIEEFDMPFEYGKTISFDRQMEISIQGTQNILEILSAHDVKATFFITANFAIHASETVKNIVQKGHEVASHGYYHSDFKNEHLLQSRLKLEEISGEKITGYRMARMMPVDEQEIAKAGYQYNTSINPTFLPGRYNNLHISRTAFRQSGVWQIPASVTPLLRFPLFWLSFHNLPFLLYKKMADRTLRKDKYLNIYFHPWEFVDISDKNLGMPSIVLRNSAEKMVARMSRMIGKWKKEGKAFGRICDFVETL